MVKLRENEQKTLLTLSSLYGKADVNQIIKASGLAHAAVMRAALKLSNEKLVRLHKQKQTIVTLNEEGKTYVKKGLPERRIINSLITLGGKAKVDEVVEDAKLESQLVPIALGWLHRKGWAKIERKERTLKALKDPQKGKDEEILTLLAEKDIVVTEELSKEKQGAVVTLGKRKLVETEEKTFRILELTAKGRRFIKKGVKIVEEVSQLTPELIVTGKWRETKLRKFNVTASGPPAYPGKVHPLQQIIERAREIFLEMGFTEIRGPLVETAFWNFDALFQPQDHPAREMMDTFYLSSPNSGELPEKSVVDAVAKTHEDGWTTGSKGWGYKWSQKEAKRLVLRTHTTSETIKYLSKHKKPPIKVFSVDRVYRNEQLTYKHTAEFYQIEGIVVDKGVTLRDLMGTLKTFYSRFGLKMVQFWPCYFPYTEPSAQAMVYVPKLKHWMELCGMGMFRPEVLAPMGIKYPVLAWGGGLERIAMLELGLDDIRLLYGNRLGWIRRTPICR
ncbi:MAG: phenylalanine--tRNA ligase subunit alpha [Candidatus Bathyarchaeota archaeon]|nr:phenylalanine--tRNA ligase subunit alpha [Candidatus Bathyarchaeota archaeon]MDH5494110.1 phenylalanine--tRNA ligase subunit alpha [Candidatus Bathyarchaeota archaeon]